jgi:hypothetical protein
MKRLSFGVLVSGLFHACLFGAALGIIAWNNAHAQTWVDIDLNGSSLLQTPAAISKPAPPMETWFLPNPGKIPAPKAQPVTQTSPMDWMPVALTAHKPTWVSGMIAEDDYPADMRKQG